MITVETFNKSWKHQAKPYLRSAFDAYTPRSEFLRKKKSRVIEPSADADNEKMNILEVKTSLSEFTGKVGNFDMAWKDCDNYQYIRELMSTTEEYVAEHVWSASATFVTFSTDITGATSAVNHLHPLMNTDRCNVWTFAIPLYIGERAPEFLINMSENTWPARYLLDPKRIKAEDLDYMRISMPKDGSIFNMQFDGSRHPHVITYTDSVYMWFVFDGVEFKDGRDVRHTLTIGKM